MTAEPERFRVTPAVFAKLTGLVLAEGVAPPRFVFAAAVSVPLVIWMGPANVLVPLNVVAVPLVLLTRMPPVPVTLPE